MLKVFFVIIAEGYAGAGDYMSIEVIIKQVVLKATGGIQLDFHKKIQLALVLGKDNCRTSEAKKYSKAIAFIWTGGREDEIVL